MPAKISKTKAQKPKTHFAKKSFGQNFLVDQNYIAKIISALNPKPDETIIEIGAGRGALTEKLIESGANVIAVELEREMITVLKEKFAGKENFTLIESDALKVDFEEFKTDPRSQIPDPKSFKLVANLPYYISTAILQKLIAQRDCFSEMVLMFQREVVERITAEIGNSERGYLTVITEAFLDAEKLFDVSPHAFRPAPKVWSAVVRMKPKTEVEIKDAGLFREIVGLAFRQKRKTILNNLKNLPPDLQNILEKIGGAQKALVLADILPERRAETLTLAEWIRFYKIIAAR